MLTLVLDIVTTAAILFIVSAGLLIVFGVMKIINFAHAAFLTVGAYAALVASQLGLPLCWRPPLAFLVGGLLGAVAEIVVVRPLYRGRSTRSWPPGGSASSSASSSRSCSAARCSSCRLRFRAPGRSSATTIRAIAC